MRSGRVEWSPGQVPFPTSYAPLLAPVISTLLAERGVEAPTSRAIAAAALMSPSSLTNNFGGRDRMLELCAEQAGRQHERFLRERAYDHGGSWRALVPAYDRELAEARAWQGWRALALCRPAVAAGVMVGVRAERAIIAELLGFHAGGVPAGEVVDEAADRYAGLLARLVTPGAGPSPDRTGDLWQDYADRLVDRIGRSTGLGGPGDGPRAVDGTG